MRVGIIGCGQIFDLNVLGYLESPEATITCLCNRHAEKAEEKIIKFNLDKSIRVYSDYKRMLNEEPLDIVEILLPHHLHAEATIFAAQKGLRGISVQKPMAMTLEEANKMIESCAENKTILSIYENFLFAPHIIKAKELIDSDYLGDIASIRIKVAMSSAGGWKISSSADEWREDPSKVGGNAQFGSPVLFDNGWHAFTLGKWLFNEPIEKVFAWTGLYHGKDAPAFVVWKCKGKKEQIVPKYGNMEFSLMPKMIIPSKYYPTDEFIEIIGSRGLMKINQCTSIGNLMSDSPVFPPLVVVRDGKVETYTDFDKDWKISFINATKHFIDVAKHGKEPILSGEQAKEILEFNLAAIKSAELQKACYIDEFK